MEGKLARDEDGQLLRCVSCFYWNCWHDRGKPCDIRGCKCIRGHP